MNLKSYIGVPLASHRLPIPLEKIDSIFENEFVDPEDENAVWRFAALPLLLDECSEATEIGDSWIRYFLKNEPNASHQFAWQPYTVSERLANWGRYLCRTGRHHEWPESLKQSFVKSIGQHSERLLSSLEYYGEEYTGNHLSNNGRGLLWASLILRNQKLGTFAETILMHEIDRIIQPQGIVREGSSHYHFLVTRNVSECLWIARECSFQKLTLFLSEKLGPMLEGCRLLKLQNQLPQIGDTSPDITPEYLDSVLGIHTEKTGIQDDFARYDSNGFSILVHVNVSGHPIIASHAHHDSGSPVVIYKGELLLLDPGRKSYQLEDSANREATAHNSIQIDGRPMEVWPRKFHGKKYLRYRCGPAPKLQLKPDGIYVELNGYSTHNIQVSRKFSVEKNRFKIDQFVQGSGTHKISIRLNLLDSSLATILWPEGGIHSSTPISFSKRYGENQSAVQWLWEMNVALPWQGTIYVNPEGEL